MFPCSGDWDTSKGHDIAGVYELYNYALGNVSLAGPTYFAPLIRFVNQRVATEQEYNPLKYHVLLIITDGSINDEQETKDAIVESSSLPMSIIIIGVGHADFSAMDRLDSDGSVDYLCNCEAALGHIRTSQTRHCAVRPVCTVREQSSCSCRCCAGRTPTPSL